jgi:tagatose 1,6-diphosphate aldolase
MTITPGKLAGMKAVSNDRGVIAAAAMDQRGSLKKALAKDGANIGDSQMEEFKSLVAEVLTKHASAILLDPEWGLPASKRRAPGAGLLLAYEKTGYDKTGPGRLPDLLDEWSVRRLKEAGADCIKILLYYTPFDPKDVNDKKHAWVERIGDECRANDIPFFPSSSATRRARTRRGSSTRRRSRRSSAPAWRSSPRIATAWTS